MLCTTPECCGVARIAQMNSSDVDDSVSWLINQAITFNNVDVFAQDMTDGIKDFLTAQTWQITDLKAFVEIDELEIVEPQMANVMPSVQSIDIPYPAGTPAAAVPVPLNPSSLQNGVLTHAFDIDKEFGNLQSTGYVYIGEDPDSQEEFDVEDEFGQREFTTVKLFRDDIEEFL